MGTKIYLAGYYMHDVFEFNTETEQYNILKLAKPKDVITLFAPAGDRLMIIPSEQYIFTYRRNSKQKWSLAPNLDKFLT